ncbi:MAG: hypothetical protein L0211_18775 [Planctomycetaceae bacterium]|nr:hypothetical protein [Planctomycetaceae bacterium]
MTTTRDQLISDWRQRLAAAEETVGATPRAAWLARMQVRLYRFLLACYGNSDWEPQPGKPSTLVFDSAEAKALDGKPAKSLGQIRSVLTAVAKAQDDPHAPGPLAAGLDHDSWVVVAAASSKLKTGRCAELLAKAGLHPRRSFRGDDELVEVPAYERHEAFDLVEQYRERIHQPPKTPRTQPIPAWCRFAALAILALWTTGLLTWVLAAVAWSSTGPVARNISPIEFMDGPAYFGIWFSLYLVALLGMGLAFLRRLRPVRRSKPD